MIPLLLSLMTGCGAEPVECPACPEPPPAPKLVLDDWEAEVLAPVLAELRGGIARWDEEAWGICEGTRACDRYLGADAADLPPGDYLVQAILQVPAQGGPWKVAFDVKCKTAIEGRPDAEQHHEREFEVKHTGSHRGYPLRPLWKIKSPHPQGARSCTFELTGLRSDGQVLETWTGSYSTPARVD